MIKAKYILVVMMMILSLSCAKDKVDEENSPENESTVHPISDGLHSFLFDSGSWWKYSNGSIADCTYIDKSELDVKAISNGAITEYNDCLYSDYLSSQNGAYSEETFAAIITRATKESGWVFCTNIEVGGSNQNIDFLDQIDTLSIYGTDYLEVRKIYIHSSINIPNDMIFYYCQGIGVVKKEMIDNGNITETWELVDSDVSLFPY